MRKTSIFFLFVLFALLANMTDVGAQVDSPLLNENFDGISSGIPAGWDNSAGTTTETAFKWSYYDTGYAGHCVRFNSCGNWPSGSTNMLMTPAMDLSSGEWVLKFKYKNPEGGDFSVFISTDGGTTYTTPLVTGLTGQYEWTEEEVSLTAAANGSSNVKIVFRGTSSYNSEANDVYIYLDDVLVEKAPTCKSPTGLSVSNLTHSGATLSWSLTPDGFVPASYIYTLTEAGGNVIEQNAALSAPTLQYVIATPLTPNTTYTASLQGDCRSDYQGSSRTTTVTFTTPCAAQNAPYQQNFEALTTLPECTFSNNASISNSGHLGGKGLALTTTAAANAYIIFPEVNIPSDNVEISFWITASSPYNGHTKFNVGLITDPTDDSSFEILYDDSLTSSTWREIRMNTSATGNPVTNTASIALFVMNGYDNTVTIDDVSIHAVPSCVRPENPVILSYGSDNVTLDWNVTDAPNVRIYAQNMADYSVVDTLASQHPFTMSGLMPETNYEFTLRGICSQTDSSDISVPVSVRTRCAVAESTTFFEGAESTYGTIPDCWETGYLNNVSESTSSPFQTQTSTKIGSRGFKYLNTTSGSIAYLCSRPLNFDQAGKYTFRYQINRRSGSSFLGEGLKVFVTPTLGDTTNAIEVIPFVNHFAPNPPVGIAGWNEYEGVINYQGIGYIMIVGYTKYGLDINFDNLQVILTPTCQRVSNITVNNIASTTADIKWNAGGTETQWLVDYQVRQGSSTIINVTDSLVSGQPVMTITGLTAATTYTVTATVRALCQGNDTAEAVTMPSRAISTQCNVLSTLPYTCGFETSEIVPYLDDATYKMPICWTRINDATYAIDYYPYASTSMVGNARTGSGCLIFEYYYDSDAAEHAIAVMNGIDANTLQINNMRMRFYARKYSTEYSDYPLVVGVMSDPYDLTTFVAIDTVYVDNYNAYDRFVIPFNKYTGNGTYPALMSVGTKSTSVFGSKIGEVYVDDLTLELIPSCTELEGSAVVTDITDHSARVTIDDATAESGWSYAFDLTGTLVDDMAAVDATGAFVELSGLAPATTYDLYVRRHCGDEYGTWSDKVTFTTSAIAAQMPFICDFEDDLVNEGWMYVDGAGSNVFTIGSAETGVYEGSHAIYVSTSRVASPHTYNEGSSTQAYAYRTLHFDAKGYQVEFKFKSTGGEGAYDFGRIFLAPASEQLTAGNIGSALNSTVFPNITAAFDADYVASGSTIPQLNNYTTAMGNPDANGWHTVSYFLDMTTRPGNYNFVMMWSNDDSAGSITYPLAVDDINIYELTCIPPSNVMINNLTSSGATIDIQQEDVSQWEVVVNNQPFDSESIPEEAAYRAIVNSGEVNLSGLTPNTIYYYAIRSICDEGDTSKWGTIATFHTYCSTYNVPYFEDFESLSSTDCWSNVNPAVGSVSRNTGYHRNGSASMKIESAQVVSPELNVTTLEPFMISGWFYATEDNVPFTVGVFTDPNNVSSFVPMGDGEIIPAKNTWTEFTTYFTPLGDPDNIGSRNARYIGIAVTGDKTIYVDDITIDSIPDCPKPTSIVITNVTAHSFDISFTDHANASQWVVYTNGTPNVINSNPATISGLAAATSYSVEIAAICGSADTSSAAMYGTIRTGCDVMPLPYVCSFEQSEGFTLISSYSFVDGALEAGCWAALNASSNLPTYMIANDSYVSAGKQGLKVSGSPDNNLYAILPALDIPTPAANLSVKFKSMVGDLYNCGSFEFGYLTDPTDESTWVSLYTNIVKSTTFATTDIVLTNVPSSARLAFKYSDPYGWYYYSAIDEVEVKEIKNCSDPETPIFSNITSSSADVAFTDTCAAHQNWQYVYGPAANFNVSSLTPQTLNGTTFSLTGLTDDTEYKVAVRAVCGAGDESNWIIASFHTQCSPFAVSMANPYLDSFEDAENNAEYGNICYEIGDRYYEISPYGSATSYTITAKENIGDSYYQYLYSHSGDKCLVPNPHPTYTPNGLTLMRMFHFEADKVYKARIYAGSTGIVGTNSLTYMLGTTNVVSQMNALEVHTVPGGNNSFTPGTPNTIDYSVLYAPYETYFQVAATGDYYLGINFNSTYEYGTPFYVDDFTVEETSGCMPTIFTISETTENSVTVTMDDQDPTHSWEYVVTDNTGDTAAAGTMASNPYTVNGLVASSGYTINIRHICGDGDYSDWKTRSFRTQCGVATLPYVCSFEANEGFKASYSYVAGTAEAGCWSVLNSSTDGSIPYYYITNSSSYVMNGAQSFEFHGAVSSVATNQDLVAIMPAFDHPAGSLLINFNAMYDNVVDGGELEFGYLTDPSDINTWASLSAVPKTAAYVSIPVEVDMTMFQGIPDNARLAIRYGKAASTWYYAWIDNIHVQVCPSCREPQRPATVSSTTMTTMNVNVTMGNKPKAQVACAVRTSTTTAADIDMTTAVITTTGTAVLTGLTGATTYAVYYRYICGDNDTSAWSSLAVGTTTESDCFAPQNLHVVGILDDHHVEFTWGKAPEATIYKWELKKGNIVVASGDTAAALIDTMTFDTLEAATTYSFRVRCICGTADSSAWVNMSFSTTHETYTVPYVCNFETAEEQSMWNLLKFAGMTDFHIGTAESNGGNYGLYASSDNGMTSQYAASSDIYAVSLITLPAGNYIFSYDWRCMAEGPWDNGIAYLVPATTLISATNCQYNNVPAEAIKLMGTSQYLGGSYDWQNQQSMVEITNSGVYQLIFAFHSDYGNQNEPGLCVDNISVQAMTCMPVSSVAKISTTCNDAMYLVTRNNASHDIEYGYSIYDAEGLVTWTTIPGGNMRDTIVLTGLAPHTTYYLFVREVCGDDDVSTATRVSLTTPSMPQSMPFVCGFEAAESTADSWQFANGANGFIVGYNAQFGGSKSLYISDDGSSWRYAQSPVSSYSYAYIPLAFGEGTYDIEYKWQANGELNFDYARVYLVPSSFTLNANVLVAGISTSGSPAGWIPIDGGNRLNDVTEWQSKNVEYTFADSTVMNMVVVWVNDGSGGSQYPIAIDDISITRQNCPSLPLDSVGTDSVGKNYIAVHFYSPNEEAPTQWILSTNSQFTDTVAIDTVPASGRSLIATGLNASTMYYLALSSLCSDEEHSKALIYTIRTNCEVITQYPYDEGFENFEPNTNDLLTGACWLAEPMSGTKYAIAVNTAQNFHDGNQGLYVYNDYDYSHNSPTQTLALPEMASLNGKYVSFWHKAYNMTSSSNTLSFGYLDGEDQFVSLNDFLIKSISWQQYSTVLQNLPADVTRLAFRFAGTQSYHLDDIHVNSIFVEDTIFETVCYTEDYSGHGINIPSSQLAVGENIITRIVNATVAGAEDTLVTLNINRLANIATTNYDTVCAGQPYYKGEWHIDNPTSIRYFNTFPNASYTGCDSTVELYLTVLPSSEVVYDTICQGDVYPLDTMLLTQTGVYTAYTYNKLGCEDTITLHLYVVDSVLVTNASICQGSSYTFEGQTYTQTGTYRISAIGSHGCAVAKILNLTVFGTDSICNVSFCKGGSVQVADTVIMDAGIYTLVRVNASGCDVTYHITATEDLVRQGNLSVDACEGHKYTGYGIDEVLTKDTVVTQTSLRTADGKCDSMTVVTIKVIPAIWMPVEYVSIDQGQSYTWHGNTYTTPVFVRDTVTSLATGCDSICTLSLTVGGVSPDAVENVQLLNISVIPNPVNAGQTSFIYGDFENVRSIEVLNSFGQVIDAFVPETYPIEVQGINASGIYYVRVVTEDERIAVQKLIVR